MTSEQTTIFLLRAIPDEGGFTYFNKPRKWPPFYRRHFQMHSFKREALYLAHISLTFVAKGPNCKWLGNDRCDWRRTGVIEHIKQRKITIYAHSCDVFSSTPFGITTATICWQQNVCVRSYAICIKISSSRTSYMLYHVFYWCWIDQRKDTICTNE